MATTYCVIIDGIADTAKRDRVVAELAFTFKRSHEKTVRMLARLPYAVRKGVDFRTAVKYETLLRSCGCLCKIETEPYAGAAAAAAAEPVAVPSAPVDRADSGRAGRADVRSHLPQVDWAAWADRLAAARDALPSPRLSWTAGGAIALLLLAALYVAWPSGQDAAPAAPDMLSSAGAPVPNMNPAAPALPNAALPSANLTTMTRKEFESAIRGKNEAQIIAAVGPPTLTTENLINGARMSLWTYYDRTRMTESSALDKAVIIDLRDGWAQSLLY